MKITTIIKHDLATAKMVLFTNKEYCRSPIPTKLPSTKQKLMKIKKTIINIPSIVKQTPNTKSSPNQIMLRKFKERKTKWFRSSKQFQWIA